MEKNIAFGVLWPLLLLISGLGGTISAKELCGYCLKRKNLIDEGKRKSVWPYIIS